ncbi:MAG TPA: hypothetical protein VKX16_12780 [Chloroflexota bacterium]|nr:hypothetical protein [Chloroflexota bacterium]
MAKKVGKKQAAERLERAQKRLDAAERRWAEAEAEARRLIEKAELKAARLREEAGARLARRRQALERTQIVVAPEAEPAGTEEPQTTEFVPEIVPATSESSRAILADREARALRALQGLGRVHGATAQEWRVAVGMPPTTFSRARDGLLEAGLVSRDGDNPRDSRYILTAAGSTVEV